MKVYVIVYDCTDTSTIVGDVFDKEADALISAKEFASENRDFIANYEVVEVALRKNPLFKKMCPQCGKLYWLREVRSEGTIYCSTNCAKSSAQKAYRQRKKTVHPK